MDAAMEKDAQEIPNAAPAGEKKPSHKKRHAGMVLLVLIIAGAATGMNWLITSKTHITTDNAFVESHIYSVSARVPGTVAHVLVNDNQYVKNGDLLVELDANDYRTRVQNAAAQLDIARNETSSTYAQVDAARAAVNSDKAKLEQAGLDLERGKALYKKEVIPKEQLDRLETARKRSCGDHAGNLAVGQFQIQPCPWIKPYCAGN